jgi:hypothetical protein
MRFRLVVTYEKKEREWALEEINYAFLYIWNCVIIIQIINGSKYKF